MFRLVPTLQRCAVLAVFSGVLLGACANPLVANVEPTPTPVPTPVPPQKPTFKVTRGSIQDIIQAIGRVVAVEQQDLYFRVPGRLDSIGVTVQDKVKKGQVLASLDTENLKKQIEEQQKALDVAKLNIEKAKQTAQVANAGKDADIAVAQAGVQAAQAKYEGEQAKLAAMLRGPDPNQVAKAQADLQKAQADLQKTQAASATGQTGIAAAQAEQQAAQAGLNNATGSAQTALASAKSALDAAQAALAQLKAGPRPEQVAILRQAVQQAQNDLYSAQVTRDGLCNTTAHTQYDCQAAQGKVNSAQTALDTANKQLQLQLAPPTAADLAAAQANVDKAQAAYAAAQAAANNASDVASAQSTVAKAKSDYAAAVSNAQQGNASIASAQAAVTQAAVLLRIAQTGAKPEDIAQERAAVAGAQAGIAAAQGALRKAQEVAAVNVSSDTDIAILQKQADTAQLQLDALNKTLADNTILAPFDGIVISATGQPGDSIQAYMPVVTVANPTTLQIAADVPSDQVQKVAVGQKATVVMDAFPSTTINATVAQLPTTVLASSNTNPNAPGSTSGGSSGSTSGTVVDRAPKLKVSWPGPGAELGQLARVTITAEKKDDVLIIPTRALNRITNRTFVMVLDKYGKQHPQDITIGISTADQTEVLTGLKEGDTVVSR